MAKYKNGVADIELPNIKTWHSMTTLNKPDDQEVLLDTKINMASASGSGSKTDLKRSSRPSSLKVSDSNNAGLSDSGEQESSSLSCQDIKQCFPTCIILLITVIIMVTVIPYAFSNVIKYVTYCTRNSLNKLFRQMQAADAVAAWKEKMAEMNDSAGANV